jgi:hypothetical protein
MVIMKIFRLHIQSFWLDELGKQLKGLPILLLLKENLLWGWWGGTLLFDAQL